MALAIVTVCDSIAALSVTGLNILDVDQIPPDVTRLYPVLFPEPLEFVTDFAMERDSFGGGSTAKMTVTYNLHYTFCFTPIGAGRTGLDLYDEMLTLAAAILDAVLAIDTFTGGVDMVPLAPVEFGPVPDPAGNQYLGCRFTFQVQEFVN
jgi:hypothetical protein